MHVKLTSHAINLTVPDILTAHSPIKAPGNYMILFRGDAAQGLLRSYRSLTLYQLAFTNTEPDESAVNKARSPDVKRRIFPLLLLCLCAGILLVDNNDTT